MSFTGIFQFGTLTTRNGQTLHFEDVDKDNDGKISQQEFLFIQQELGLDTIELSEGATGDAESNVTDEQYVTWALELQMQKSLEAMIAQIAQDFIGNNAQYAQQVIRELKYYYDDFKESYLKNGENIADMADKFKDSLPIKYDEIKKSILGND